MRLRLAVVLVALIALVTPMPQAFVEEAYAATLFPRLQSVMTSLSNVTAMAWFDVLILACLLAGLALTIDDLRREGAGRTVLRGLWRVATVGAAAYLVFLLMWGLNYRREGLRRTVPYDAARVTPEAAVALARETVERANALHAAAHREGWHPMDPVDPSLVDALRSALPALRLPATVVPGRPKQSLLDLYFRRAGVAGMTDPFFLETLVASDILPFERPQVVAHEWAHLAGITDEGEANFVSWLTCLRGTTAHQYSGWLFLYREAVAGLPRATALEVSAALGEGPRADLRAIRERHEREVSPRVSGAGWQVYDRYLKANRVDAGTASYAEVVQLVLGTGLR
ncbi:MAG: DUF3810 family protein [Vicinamibacterales bacterium]